MRIRVRFTKTGKVRWTSHRDVARAWERAIRRVRLPIAYSQGFSPHPKVHFGLALSTGHESLAEFIDIDLDDERLESVVVDLNVLPTQLSLALPVGIEASAVAVIASNAESLQQAVTSCEWSVEVREATVSDVAAAIGRCLDATELIVTRQRKGKDVTDDVRPYLLELSVVGPSAGGTEIAAHLATQPRGLRIGELITLLSPEWVEGRVRRISQWTLLDGLRCEPLAGSPDGMSAPYAETRAS